MSKDKSVVNIDALKDTLVTEHKSYGEQMDLETFKAFLDVVNRRVPYSSRDFEKHHFIENIATTDAEADRYNNRNEFFIDCRPNRQR